MKFLLLFENYTFWIFAYIYSVQFTMDITEANLVLSNRRETCTVIIFYLGEKEKLICLILPSLFFRVSKSLMMMNNILTQLCNKLKPIKSKQRFWNQIILPDTYKLLLNNLVFRSNSQRFHTHLKTLDYISSVINFCQ